MPCESLYDVQDVVLVDVCFPGRGQQSVVPARLLYLWGFARDFGPHFGFDVLQCFCTRPFVSARALLVVHLLGLALGRCHPLTSDIFGTLNQILLFVYVVVIFDICFVIFV